MVHPGHYKVTIGHHLLLRSPKGSLKHWRKERKIALICVQLLRPMDCSLPGSSAHGIFQARILEWVAISFSRGSSWPRNQTQVSRIAGSFFTNWATQEALGITYYLHCAWRPQSSGKVERTNQFLKSAIKKDHPGDLPRVEGGFTNSSPPHLLPLRNRLVLVLMRFSVRDLLFMSMTSS